MVRISAATSFLRAHGTVMANCQGEMARPVTVSTSIRLTQVATASHTRDTGAGSRFPGVYRCRGRRSQPFRGLHGTDRWGSE